MICQTPTKAIYTHELGSPSMTPEAGATLYPYFTVKQTEAGGLSDLPEVTQLPSRETRRQFQGASAELQSHRFPS